MNLIKYNKDQGDLGLIVFLSLLCLVPALCFFKSGITDFGVLHAMDSGQEYMALILRTGKSVQVSDDSPHYRELFVLADIDGTEKCIKLLAQDVPNWECKLVYPTGGEIAIKGHGRYFTVKDYQK